MNNKGIISLSGFVLFLVVGSAMLNAQVPMGAYSSEDASRLETGDQQLTNNCYYKNLAIELKKGEGIFMYMTSSDFEPQLYMLDNALVNWVTGDNVSNGDNSYSSYLSLVADKDTIFNLVYSSISPTTTGAFAYGVYKLDANQMHYPESDEFCGRLTYIINNWLCFWKFIPYESDGILGRTIKNSIKPNNEGYIGFTESYSEVFYEDDEGNNSLAKYNEYVNKVKNCLDIEFWDISTEMDTEYSGIKYYETFFTLKGGTPGVYLESFSIRFNDSEESTDVIEILFY